MVFDWRVSRQHAELTTLLTENYKGVLQSDGYEAYASYARRHEGVVWVGCWAHARRKFFEAQKDKPKIARVALKRIGASMPGSGSGTRPGLPKRRPVQT